MGLTAKQDPNQHAKNIFVVKTYRTPDAKTYFDTERYAFQNLRIARRPPPGIIDFYGSFERGHTFNLILEYADSGTLDEHMQQVQAPSSLGDINMFWDRFSDVMRGLMTIHGALDGKSKEAQILLGYVRQSTRIHSVMEY